MKKSILLTLFFLLSFYAHAQNAEQIIDTLKAQLHKKPDAKKTAAIYSDLTWYYANISIDSALHYGSKAAAESRRLGDSVLLAQVYSDIGAVYFRKGDFQNARTNYLTAYRIRKIRKDFSGANKANANLANVYMNTNDYNAAMRSFFETLRYFETANDEANANVTRSNIGQLFYKMKNYPKAIRYLKDAIGYAEKNRQDDRLCEYFLNLGNIYKDTNDSINAIKYYNKSLHECGLSGNKKAESIVYQNIGLVKTKEGSDKASAAFFEKSKAIKEQVNSDLDKANLNLSIARAYIKSGEYGKAKKLLVAAKTFFENRDSKDDLLITYELLVPVYAHLNIPDSVGYYSEKYTSLNEALTQTAINRQTADLEARYQTAKKEKLLFEKEAEAQHKNYLLIAMSALAFFIALIGFLIYRQQRFKNNQQEQEFQLKTAIAHIETQNQLQDQRLSISRDLHDNIGAQLTFIISSVDNIRHAFDIGNAKLDNRLGRISDFTKNTIIELRDTIWAMNNDEITFEDLRARILNFIEKAKDARDEIDFRFTIDESLDSIKLTSIVGMNIYRSVQEAVNNAIKYAEASEITIEVKKIDGKIAIYISDNGIGFDPATVEKGNGLFNIEKRIEDIGGILRLASEDKKGTTISLLLN
jgi:signal transduction histidine kinase/uncharacterized protein HemY